MSFNQYGNSSGGMGGRFSFFPPVLKFLLIANVAVFAVQLFLGGFTFGQYAIGDVILTFLALHPGDSPAFFPWQFVTYMFLHGGFMHLFFNMLMLWMFGLEVEEELGQKRFLLFYLLCGIGGGLAHWLLSDAMVVGASGAIFGVMVAFAILNPNRPIYIYFLFPIPAKYVVMLYVVIDLIGGVRGGGTVANFAHLGGALVGVLYFLVATGKLRSLGLGGGRTLGGPGGRADSSAHQDKWQAFQNPWEQPRNEDSPPRGGGIGSFFKRPNRDDRSRDEDEIVDAEYYDVHERRQQTGRSNTATTGGGRVITQEEIDRILDKIAASGYQNLTEQERQILFEASKKMDEGR